MDQHKFKILYFRNLLWIAFFIAVTFSVGNIILLIFVDFIYGNPHRTKENALNMMWVFSLIFSLVALIGTFLIFSLPQLFQGLINYNLYKKFGSKAGLFVFLMLPFTALITWYCYDYLTPSDVNLGINENGDWKPYQHGLTTERYFYALAFQIPITIFSIFYFDANFRKISKKTIILLTLVFSMISGALKGHNMAQNQFELSKNIGLSNVSHIRS